MATITDVTVSAAELSLDGVTINNSTSVTSEEINRGANTSVSEITVLVTITGFASDPDSGGYISVYLAPLNDTGAILYDDVTGPEVIPVDANALYNAPVSLSWKSGIQYAKLVIENHSGQNTDTNGVTVIAKYQSITV